MEQSSVFWLCKCNKRSAGWSNASRPPRKSQIPEGEHFMANKNDNPASKAEQKSITVNVEFLGPVEGKAPSARAYLFDRNGRYVASKLVDGKPLAFQVDAGSRSQVRVGPDLLKDNKAPTDLTAQLDKAKALGRTIFPRFTAIS
jgi:hypothetical protein